MKPDAHETHTQHTFDSYCKKIVKNELINFYREVKRQLAREISISERVARQLTHLSMMDEYPFESHNFTVLGHNIPLQSDLLAGALAILPDGKRCIILLSYGLDMTDREIGELLGMVRQTVQYRRHSALKQLSALMKEGADE